LRITGYSTAYAKFERRTKLVIIKLQCNRALIERGWGVSAGPVEQKCHCFYHAMTIQFIAPQVHGALASKQWSNRRRRTTWQYIQWSKYSVGHNLGLRVRLTHNNISMENYWLSTYCRCKQCDLYKHCGQSCDQLPP